jgi:hypothetical protein
MGRHPEEFRNFDALTKRLLSVSKDTLNERLADYKERAAQNPNRRGPKPKTAKER